MRIGTSAKFHREKPDGSGFPLSIESMITIAAGENPATANGHQGPSTPSCHRNTAEYQTINYYRSP